MGGHSPTRDGAHLMDQPVPHPVIQNNFMNILDGYNNNLMDGYKDCVTGGTEGFELGLRGEREFNDGWVGDFKERQVPRDWIDSDRSRSWIEGDRFRERSSRRSFDHESGINRPWNEVVSIENRNIRELERERDREMDLNRQLRCERDREIEKQKERQLELKKEKERAREKTGSER